jgi:hypothetical protein
MKKVNLGQMVALLACHWSPRIVGERNRHYLKLVKFLGVLP